MLIAWAIPERHTTLDIDVSAQTDNNLENIENIIRDIFETLVNKTA